MEKNEQEDNNEDYEDEQGDILSGSCWLLSQPADSFSINVCFLTWNEEIRYRPPCIRETNSCRSPNVAKRTGVECWLKQSKNVYDIILLPIRVTKGERQNLPHFTFSHSHADLAEPSTESAAYIINKLIFITRGVWTRVSLFRFRKYINWFFLTDTTLRLSRFNKPRQRCENNLVLSKQFLDRWFLWKKSIF